MEQEKKIEKLVLVCIDTAKAMLDEYQTIIPFGIRVFDDSDDMKMNCPADKNPDADWNEQIDTVVSELKGFLANEDIAVTALVTALESDGEMGIGLQVETACSSVLFVYPYQQQNNTWIIDEPVQTEQLLTTIF